MVYLRVVREGERGGGGGLGVVVNYRVQPVVTTVQTIRTDNDRGFPTHVFMSRFHTSTPVPLTVPNMAEWNGDHTTS